ncbi:Uncharacterised protein [Bacillus paralicheniformis]|nr:Uncharacterised protein [Bacillus paralicheniformis]
MNNVITTIKNVTTTIKPVAPVVAGLILVIIGIMYMCFKDEQKKSLMYKLDAKCFNRFCNRIFSNFHRELVLGSGCWVLERRLEKASFCL